ncbi:SAP domain-containing protein [Strongyloides ratti]|uniref:SAP domain-containing protein n=1 Tax=Strongyloides ratti TaxID=34506 RepID=A0A090KTX2_STRRB|nr:SAP domain-containing protein [Strongyloides ratti]CEF59300.1 SAP domain-containing protein [Strongyloides ratti]
MEVISTEIKDVNINGSKNNLSKDSILSNQNEYNVMTSPNIKNKQKSNQNCQITTTVATISTSPYSQYQPSSAFVNAKLAAGSSEVIHVSKSISTPYCDNQQQYIHNQNPKGIVNSNNLMATKVNSSYYQPSGNISSNTQPIGEKDINVFSTTDSSNNSIKNNSYMPITRHYLTNQRSNLSKNINNSSQLQNNTCYQNNYKVIEKSPNFEYGFCDNTIKNIESSPLPHSSTPLSSISYSSSTENAPIININETETKNKAKLSFMKVSELKSECKKRNISSNGSKTQLLERLQPYEESILSLNKEENDQDNVKSMTTINASNQQHSVNQVTTEYYITDQNNEYITKQYDSQNNRHSNNFSNQISKRMPSLTGNISSLNNIDPSDGMSGAVIINNQLQNAHIDLSSTKNEIIKEENNDNYTTKNQSYYVEVPSFKISNNQSSQQYVHFLDQTGTTVSISSLPKNIATTSNQCQYTNNIVVSGSNQSDNVIYYNQISQQTKQNNQDNNSMNSQSGKYNHITISNNMIKSGNSNHLTLTKITSDNEIDSGNCEIYQQNTPSKMYTSPINSQESYINLNNVTNYQSQSNNNLLPNSSFQSSNDIVSLNTPSTIISYPSNKQSISNIKENDNINNTGQNSGSYVILQKEPRQWNTVSRNLDSYRVMPIHQKLNSFYSNRGNDDGYQRNNYNQTYPVQEYQKDLQKTIDHTDSTNYHMGVKHAALTSSIKNTNPNDTLKNFIFKSFPVNDINKSFQEISSEVKKIFCQNKKNPIEKSEPVMTAEIMQIHEDMIQQQFSIINKLYSTLSNAQYQLKNYQNILIAANNFDAESISRREALYPTLNCLKELDTRTINRKYMKLYSNYENIYHNLKDGVKEHQSIVDNEEVLQDLAHVTQATEDIVRLIKQDSRTALLIVQLLRNFQVERSQCVSRRSSFNVPPNDDNDLKNINEQRKDQRQLETGFFKGQFNCNQVDLLFKNDNQINGIDRLHQSNIKDIKNGKNKIDMNIKNTSIYSNNNNSNINLPGPSKIQNKGKNNKSTIKIDNKISNKQTTLRRKGIKNNNKSKDDDKILNETTKTKKSTSTGKINDMEEIFKTVIKESSKCVTGIESKERAEEVINDYVKNPPNSSPITTNNNINGINYTTTIIENTAPIQSQIQQSNNNNTSQNLVKNNDSQYGNSSRKRINSQTIQKQNQIQQKSPKIQQCTISRIDTLPQTIQIQQHSSPTINQHLQPNSVETMDSLSSQQQYHYQTFQNDQNEHFSPINSNINCLNSSFIQTDQTQQYNNMINSNQLTSTTFFAIPTNSITMNNHHHQQQQQSQYGVINSNVDDNGNFTYTTTNLSSPGDFTSPQHDQNRIISNTNGTQWITTTQSTSHLQQNLCNTSIDNSGNHDITIDSGIQHPISSIDINTSKSGEELNVLLDDSWYNNDHHTIYENIQNNSTNSNNQTSSSTIKTTSSSIDGDNIRNTIYSNNNNNSNPISQQNNSLIGYNQNFSDSDSFNYENNDINQQGDQTMDWVDQQLMT